MKPYYEESGITIYHGHWMEFVADLPVVDCVVTDPPYGETSLDWDSAELAWLSAMNRVVAQHGSIWSFGSLRYLSMLLNCAGMAPWRQSQEVVWEKHNGSGFHADRFKRVHELAVHLYRRDTAWADVYKKPVYTSDATARTVRRKQRPPHMGRIGQGAYVSQDGGPRLMRSVMAVRSCHGDAEHPTQKPLGIITPLLEYSACPGGLVLDLFMGSGSTLVAARSGGWRAIGIEIEERYCEIAAKRLAQDVMTFEETA